MDLVEKMKTIEIDYEVLVQDALRLVVHHALSLIEKNGLIGDHHFYISFATDYPGVQLPDYLKDEYPEEITIVLQHEFWDLKIEDDLFSVTLCFNDVNEYITVPFRAITSFVDPSVKFGLQFTPDYDVLEEPLLEQKSPVQIEIKVNKASKKKSESTKKINTKESSDSANVITLDTFRKK